MPKQIEIFSQGQALMKRSLIHIEELLTQKQLEQGGRETSGGW